VQPAIQPCTSRSGRGAQVVIVAPSITDSELRFPLIQVCVCRDSGDGNNGDNGGVDFST
jgi:hypothetical protein